MLLYNFLLFLVGDNVDIVVDDDDDDDDEVEVEMGDDLIGVCIIFTSDLFILIFSLGGEGGGEEGEGDEDGDEEGEGEGGGDGEGGGEDDVENGEDNDNGDGVRLFTTIAFSNDEYGDEDESDNGDSSFPFILCLLSST